MNALLNKKNLIIIGFFFLLSASMFVTLNYENFLTEGISITVTIMSSIALFFLAMISLFDTILDIFNP